MKRIKATQSAYLKLCPYGQPGAGKTRFAGTAALDSRTAPVLWLNLSGNPLSIRDYEKHPDILDIEALDDVNQVYDWLTGGQKETDPIVKKYDLVPGYKTLVIDGITDVQREILTIVAGNQKVKPGTTPRPRELQHYNPSLDQMVMFAKYFFNLKKMHVIITALEREETDPDSQKKYYRPLLLGQAAGEVAGYAYTVMRMVPPDRIDRASKKKVGGETIDRPTTESIALLRGTSSYYAKDQHGTGLEFIVNPTVTAFLDAMGAPPAEWSIPRPRSNYK
jgi:hypothetical protein